MTTVAQDNSGQKLWSEKRLFIIFTILAFLLGGTLGRLQFSQNLDANKITAIGTWIAAIAAIFATFLAGYFASKQNQIAATQNQIIIDQSRIFDKQNELLNQQLRVDLFDKRFDAYQAVINFLGKACSADTSEEVFNTAMGAFAVELNKATFLFNRDIQDYMQQIYDRAYVFYHADTLAMGNRTPRYTRLELLQWFGKQISLSKSIFDPYILLSEIRSKNL